MAYDRRAVMAEICARMAEGEALKDICASDKKLPRRSAVHLWIATDPELARLYELARFERAELYADEIASIADKCKDPRKATVRIDARKWAAAHLNPKRYGKKIAHVGGGDEDAPIRTEARAILDVAGLTDEQLRALAGIPVLSG